MDLDLRSLMDDWHALTYALNAINRSMGQEDLYPFVLSPPVIDKLALVDTLIAEAAADRALTSRSLKSVLEQLDPVAEGVC